MTAEERQHRIQEIAQRVAERLADQWPAAGAHVNDLEDFAERVGHEVQREVSAEVLQEEAARKEGNQSACPCGGRATFQRFHGLWIVTGAGRLRVRRAYYECRQCGRGHCPADARLGLGPAHTTPTAQARLAVLATLEPYVQVADLIFQLGLPLELDLKSTERVTQALGAQLAAAGDPRPHAPTQRPVALGFDGVMVPTWEGRKEARVGVIYEPDPEAPRTPAGEAQLRKEYFATTGSRESLVAAVCARAQERAGGSVVAVVSDGAALAWVELDRYLPRRVEILDFYHVLERVGEVARAMHPAEPAQALAWQKSMKKELLEIGPWKLVRELEAWEPTEAAQQEVRRVQLAYFQRQQERMRYPEYRRRGFPLGS
ncbi:MAG TPA: hypothetical protein VFU47_11655, partial [Armatimonadota bacterium]|nr:hypothetical protein [Armatimonadota bacterium]